MIVQVYRGDGDREGQPISTSLLPDNMLIVRGRAEMNANAHQFIEHFGEVVFRPNMRLGQIIQFSDNTTTMPAKAKITGIMLSVSIDMSGTTPTLNHSAQLIAREPT